MTISLHLVRKQKEFPEECSVALKRDKDLIYNTGVSTFSKSSSSAQCYGLGWALASLTISLHQSLSTFSGTNK
jgi:hypothetical protein